MTVSAHKMRSHPHVHSSPQQFFNILKVIKSCVLFIKVFARNVFTFPLNCHFPPSQSSTLPFSYFPPHSLALFSPSQLSLSLRARTISFIIVKLSLFYLSRAREQRLSFLAIASSCTQFSSPIAMLRCTVLNKKEQLL